MRKMAQFNKCDNLDCVRRYECVRHTEKIEGLTKIVRIVERICWFIAGMLFAFIVTYLLI